MMLSLQLLVDHNAPASLRERWQQARVSSVWSLRQYWQRADIAQRELLREDMGWLLQYVAPERSHHAWIQLATTLIRLCSPALIPSNSEACAYFAKAADYVYWCYQADALEQHPAHFVAHVYRFTVRCAQTVQDSQILAALDAVILDGLALNE